MSQNIDFTFYRHNKFHSKFLKHISFSIWFNGLRIYQNLLHQDSFVASLRLKNERGERLTSHRSDHVTGVRGGLHSLCNVQIIFPHLGVQQVQLCSQPSHPFIPIVIMIFYSTCELFFSLCAKFLSWGVMM